MAYPDEQLHITMEASEASDSWGFVGRVMIGDHESYRTLRAFSTPSEAVQATQVLVGEVLGSLLAGQEWRALSQELGHAPKRDDLNLGLGAAARRLDSDETSGTGLPR